MRARITILTTAAVLAAAHALATDDPHGSGTSISCEQCHIAHGTLGEILVNSADSLVATLCISCHSPGGWIGMSKELSSAQQAQPGATGTSHRWDAPAENAARGAELPQTTALLQHLSADSSITCATCHDPHSNSVPPFLRLDNSADALCLDCHRSRDMASVRTYTATDLSHPVGVSLPATSTFHNPPLDADGQGKPYEGIHYTDSNSATEDGP